MELIDRLIPQTFHHISNDKISENAIFVVKNLVNHGFESYLVGGCVRDLFLGKQPKDFDVTTAATPEEVVRVFNSKDTANQFKLQFSSKKNIPFARIIGKRFKIVHITFSGEEIIEVATFRAKSESTESITVKLTNSDLSNTNPSQISSKTTEKETKVNLEQVKHIAQAKLNISYYENKFEKLRTTKTQDTPIKQYVQQLGEISLLYKNYPTECFNQLPTEKSLGKEIKNKHIVPLALAVLAHSVIMDLPITTPSADLIRQSAFKFRKKPQLDRIELFCQIVAMFGGSISSFTSKFLQKINEFNLLGYIFPIVNSLISSEKTASEYYNFIDHNISDCCDILDNNPKHCRRLISLIMIWPLYMRNCSKWFLPYFSTDDAKPTLKEFFNLLKCENKLNASDLISYFNIVDYINKHQGSKIRPGNISHQNQTYEFYEELCNDQTEINVILGNINLIATQIQPFFKESSDFNLGLPPDFQKVIKRLLNAIFLFTIPSTQVLPKISLKMPDFKAETLKVAYVFLKYLQNTSVSESISESLNQFQERLELIISHNIQNESEDSENETKKKKSKSKPKGKSSSETVVTGKNGMLIRDNNYGTLEEDTTRRDFTLNSLYYDVITSNIHDFHNGINAILDKKVDIIGEPNERYREDPVRMLRAIRFSAKLGMEITPRTAEPIKANAHLLHEVSNARMYDEMGKMFLMGSGLATFKMMEEYNVLKPIFPTLSTLINNKKCSIYREFIEHFLENTDARIANNKEGNLCFMYAAMLWPVLHKSFEEFIISFETLQNINHIALELSNPETPAVKVVQHIEALIEQINSSKTNLLASSHITRVKNKMKVPAECRKVATDFVTLIKSRLKKEFIALSTKILTNQSQFTAFPWFIFDDIQQIWYLQFAFSFTEPSSVLTFIEFGRFKASLDFLEYRCRLDEKLIPQFEFWDNGYKKNADKIKAKSRRSRK